MTAQFRIHDLLYIVVLFCAWGVIGCGDHCNDGDPWCPIDMCIMAVKVEYNSETVVENEVDVGRVFNEFLLYADTSGLEIFGWPADDWRFKSATPHGTYRGKKYWQVMAERYRHDDDQWRRELVFDVGENGDVVRLLGCI